jgi:UDP-3-O-acyl-N-acetylglucosamine deacetylase
VDTKQIVDDGFTAFEQLEVVLCNHEIDNFLVNNIADFPILGGLAINFLFLLHSGGFFHFLSLLQIALGEAEVSIS